MRTFVLCTACLAVGWMYGLNVGHHYGEQAALCRAKAALVSEYERGYCDGLTAAGTQAFRDGLIEGAAQMLLLYEKEGAHAMREQIKVLRGTR